MFAFVNGLRVNGLLVNGLAHLLVHVTRWVNGL